jgi:hypothetical protein
MPKAEMPDAKNSPVSHQWIKKGQFKLCDKTYETYDCSICRTTISNPEGLRGLPVNCKGIPE